MNGSQRSRTSPVVCNTANAIAEDFGSVDAFRAHFTAAATTVQGSGWAILAWEPLGQRLVIEQLYDHQGNLASGAQPLLMLDVWEHAFYLQYKNDKAAYAEAFWHIVDWADVGRLAPLLAAVVRDSLPGRVLMRQRTADRLVSWLLEETTARDFVGATAWTPGGHPIGLGTAVQAGRRHEVRLAVQPGWRGEGVGSALHDHVLAAVGTVRGWRGWRGSRQSAGVDIQDHPCCSCAGWSRRGSSRGCGTARSRPPPLGGSGASIDVAE